MTAKLPAASVHAQKTLLPRLYAFSLPTKADNVPAGPNWIHEIKYDGYRMLVVREQDRVRLISRGAGRCRHWIKIKNPAHPAYSRVRDQLVRLGNFAG
jgi:hypothetical protein